MLFVQCDDVVQDFPPATSDPALRYSILPGRANARPLGLQTSRLQERNHLMVELRVPIQNAIARPGDPMPGGGNFVTASFALAGNLYMNNPGEVVFNAKLDTDENKDNIP